MSATVTPIRADADENLLRLLHTEDRWDVPAEQRRTCAEHAEWRDKCVHLPHKADAGVAA